MPAKIIDGKSIATLIRAQVSNGVKQLAAGGMPVKLVAILVGDNPAAAVYAENQRKTCVDIGIDFELRTLPASTSTHDLHAAIHALNSDPHVTGIFLHAPLPPGL